MWYAGVGSRDTSEEIGLIMTALARELELLGWKLRSGAALGADTFFEDGVSHVNNKEIFIHKEYAHGRRHNLAENVFNAQRYADYAEAVRIASEVHPAWHRCSESAKQLHARNIYQVLGPGMDPKFYSKMLVCWALPDKHGVPKGGTRTAWKVAELYGIKRFNLAVQSDKERIVNWLEQIKWEKGIRNEPT